MTRAARFDRERRRPKTCDHCERRLVERRCSCAAWRADDLARTLGGPDPDEDHAAGVRAEAIREAADEAALRSAQSRPRMRPPGAQPLPTRGTGPGGKVTTADLIRHCNRPDSWAQLGLAP